MLLEQPFGGIQTILSADFLELPPVQNEFEKGDYAF